MMLDFNLEILDTLIISLGCVVGVAGAIKGFRIGYSNESVFETALFTCGFGLAGFVVGAMLLLSLPAMIVLALISVPIVGLYYLVRYIERRGRDA